MVSSDCWDKALDLLAMRSHFRRQLEQKLQARNFEADDIAETLDRLSESGYIDDERVAIEFANTRLRKGPIGRRRMRLELEKRGAGEVAVDSALEEVFAGRSDMAATREAAERWARRGRGDAAALARHLARLGFDSSSVYAVVAEFRSRAEGAGE